MANRNQVTQNLLFFSNHLRGPRGSAGARSWHQTRALSETFAITVVIPAIDPVTSQVVTPDTYDGLNENVTVKRIWTSKNDRSRIVSRAVFFMTAMCSQVVAGLRASRPALVICMSLPVTQLLVARMVSLVRRVPLVVDVRDLPFETAGEIGYLKNRYLVGLLKKTENYLLRRADLVVTNSPRYLPYLQRKGVAPERIHLAPIGYDDFPPPSKAEVDAWRRKLIGLFPSPPEFLAIYAGTIGYAFPVEELLEGAKRLVDNRKIGFAIVGDGQKLTEMQSFAAAHELNAVFTGRVTKADVHAICRATDICLYPAREGEFSAAILGNKIFDYLGAEKPVVYCGPDSAVADVIEELGAGIVCPPRNPKKLAQAIETLSKSPDLIARYQSAASGFRNAGYTAQASAEKVRDLVVSLLANPGGEIGRG